eukprot:m.171265 g.171265  ORF g.171265 m.171265 type:complete len:544 (-) comp10387_c0_seq3:1727-3358(-)
MARPSKVTVVVHSARHLPSEPLYASLSLAGSKSKTELQSGPEPQWDTMCTFVLSRRSPGSLRIRIKTAKGTVLCHALLDIGNLSETRPRPQWHPLELEKHDHRNPFNGEVLVQVWASEMSDGHSPRGSPHSSPHGSRRNSLSDNHSLSSHISTPPTSRSPSLRGASPRKASFGWPRRDSNHAHRRSSSDGVAQIRIEPPTPTPRSPSLVRMFGPREVRATGGELIVIEWVDLKFSLNELDSILVGQVDHSDVASLTATNPARLVFVIKPSRKEGPRDVVVTIREGDSVVQALREKIVYVPPIADVISEDTAYVSGISPRTGPAGGHTQVKIRGENLGLNRQDVRHLYIAGVDCVDSIESVSPTIIKCTTKAGTGTGHIVVVTESNGVGTSGVKFAYAAPLRMRTSHPEEHGRYDPIEHEEPETPTPETSSPERLTAIIRGKDKEIRDLEDQLQRHQDYVARLIVEVGIVDRFRLRWLTVSVLQIMAAGADHILEAAAASSISVSSHSSMDHLELAKDSPTHAHRRLSPEPGTPVLYAKKAGPP